MLKIVYFNHMLIHNKSLWVIYIFFFILSIVLSSSADNSNDTLQKLNRKSRRNSSTNKITNSTTALAEAELKKLELKRKLLGREHVVVKQRISTISTERSTATSGVNNNKSSKEVTSLKPPFNHTSTQTEHPPKKPLITEPGEEPVLNVPAPNAAEYEEYKKPNRADYIVPIVAVIFSVPLVAIFISIVYRKFTDWWQHRTYRRMDFLIEGMYNN